MIKFKKVKAQNFLSIGKDPIEIEFKKGLSITMGINKDRLDRSNGSGKSSTMTEPIYFALFGKTIRGLNKTDVINKKFKKGTEVELDFDIGEDEYKIIRKLKPSELQLFKNKKDISRDSITNTQEDIEKLLGVSEDVIKNCVIMGINQTVPFMAQSKVEKRKFIEGIFDMSVFSEMLKDARSEYNEKAKELTSETAKQSEKEKNYQIYREQSEKFEEAKAQRIEKIKSEIYDENEHKKDLEKRHAEYLDKDLFDQIDILELKKKELSQKKKEKIQPKLNEYNSLISENKTEIRILNQQIDSAFTSGTCPTCKREMSEHDSKGVQDHINDLKTKINLLTGGLDQYNKKLEEVKKVESVIDKQEDDLETQIENLKSETRKMGELENKIEDSKNNIQRLFKNVKEIKEEVNNLDEVIKNIDKERKELEESIQDLNKDIKILDQIKFIVGENGVKSFIINKLLGVFNTKINEYLEKLNANCVLTFDEFFEEKIVNDKNQECSYFNFSSGERRNIDIAIMFAFMDLQKLQGKFDTNLYIYDELIDSSLDVDGIQYVLDILLEKCKDGKSIYLITHRKEAIKAVTGEVVTIQKQNNISTRIYK